MITLGEWGATTTFLEHEYLWTNLGMANTQQLTGASLGLSCTDQKKNYNR